MNNVLRPVEIYKKTNSGKEFLAYANFHCWGVDFEEFESGPGNCSVAICELTDGQIITVMPEMIKFIDQQQEPKND